MVQEKNIFEKRDILERFNQAQQSHMESSNYQIQFKTDAGSALHMLLKLGLFNTRLVHSMHSTDGKL